MKTIISATVAGLALITFASSASADTNLLAGDNFSFENPVLTSSNADNPSSPSASWYTVISLEGSPYGSLTLPDWTFSGGQAGGVQNIAGPFGSAGSSDGAQDAWINLFTTNGPSAALTYSGTGADALPMVASNEDYTLTVAIGNRATEYSSPTGGEAGTDTLSLLVDGHTFSTTVDETQLTIGTFTDESVTLTAAEVAAYGLAGNSLGIQLGATTYGSDSGDQANFDNVRLTEMAVPEVPTWLMALGSLICLGVLVRHKTTHQSI